MTLKILYISDSLGTPIHPRGIFNYSISMVEMLKSLGADVTLVMERHPGYGFSVPFSKEFQDVGAAAITGAQTGEVYRYFLNEHFTFQWRYQLPWFRFLAERMPRVARLVQRIEELATKHHHQQVIRNDYRFMDYIPEKVAHLTKFDSFACLDRFYYSSVLRASNGMEPVEVNAKGFDAAIVDTPTYVRVAGLPASRVFAILHDLIPLRDPAMGAEWRRLFAKKLEAVLAFKPHMIFVSETTRGAFRHQFPRFAARSETVIYPTIRQELTAAAARATGRGADLVAASYAAGPNLTKEQEIDGQIAPGPRTGWDASLPYFATALSDERRKNVSLVIKAFARLAGKANMAVIGQLDRRNYFDTPASEPANICFMGYITEAEKAEVMKGSAGVIFPSLSEGFGIPIVEGAVLGAPVLCSDIPVFREVASTEASYFDPMDAESLVAAVEKALADPAGQRVAAAALQASVLTRFSQAAMSQRVAQTLSQAGLALDPAVPPAPKRPESEQIEVSAIS